jgi:hypothetical protein
MCIFDQPPLKTSDWYKFTTLNKKKNTGPSALIESSSVDNIFPLPNLENLQNEKQRTRELWLSLKILSHNFTNHAYKLKKIKAEDGTYISMSQHSKLLKKQA